MEAVTSCFLLYSAILAAGDGESLVKFRSLCFRVHISAMSVVSNISLPARRES